MNKSIIFEEELLRTLSHFEAMSMEFIFLDFDQDFLVANPDFTLDELKDCLLRLEKKKLIKKMNHDGQEAWIKTYPKKSIWKKLKSYLLF